MKTPVLDFVRQYADRNVTRLHMPGHKGTAVLGCEPFDITEVPGADALYEAAGILAQSEENAASLFGTAATVYSAEGSSQCIRAMVHLAASRSEGRPWFLAARNAHKAFLYALALADADVRWLYPQETSSVCSCMVTARQVEEQLEKAETPPAAVYLTSPDYLGAQLPMEEIAAVCHRYNTWLLVDNAHGAYLRFLEPSHHPMDLGADLCCDSAHKTLPVLTGGAYLHLSCNLETWKERLKPAMALFGSTSPSYLILASLDACNGYLDGCGEEFAAFSAQVSQTKKRLQEAGWRLLETEPWKITISCSAQVPGTVLAERLQAKDILCEYADRNYLVFMVTPQNTEEDLLRLENALGENIWGWEEPTWWTPEPEKQVLSVRQALYAPQELIPVTDALGRICAAPTVSCPPAVPIAVSGERLTGKSLDLFTQYGVSQIAVVKE